MYRKVLLILSFVFFNVSVLISQNNCFEDASINEEFFNEDIIGLYLSALDFNSGDSNVLIFDYNISWNEQDNACYFQNDSDESTSLPGFKLSFDISMFIDQFHDAPVQVADGYFTIHNIPDGTSSLTFKNTDISDDNDNLQGASFNLVEDNFSIDNQDALEALFIEAGRVPNGIYSFNFELFACDDINDSCNSVDTESTQFNIFVPTYLELITPGSSSLSDTLATQIINTYPTFQWNTEYCSSCDFSIKVSQFIPNIHESMQDALEDYSILPSEIGYYSLDDDVTVFQYPASGYESLMEGNIYVWQIKRTHETTNGIHEDLSEIFAFKIQSMVSEDEAAEAESNEFSLENIKLFIGEPKYNQLFGEAGELNGFTSVDQSLKLNDYDQSINYLIDLIQKLNDQQIEIIEVEVE